MKITKNYDLVVENEDDVRALGFFIRFIRPIDMMQCCESEDNILFDKEGFRIPNSFPSIVILNAQNIFIYFPVPHDTKYMKYSKK